jgi:thiamine-monophosphate kinase
MDPPPGHQAVLTVDAICAGVHYLPEDPPELVARKLMRVNLSDLAAMGAEPAGVLLTCAYPKDCTEDWVERFAAGLATDIEAFRCPVLGGDTVSTAGPALFSLTALGWVPQGQALRRNGARAGDVIAVTGTLGDGALGLWAARQLYSGAESTADLRALAARYHLPQPRLAAGQALRGVASAAMDISDGLVQDLGHICRASGVRAEIFASALPMSEAFLRLSAGQGEHKKMALSGGDDYELCLTIPPQQLAQAIAAAGETGLTVIGRCFAGDVESDAPVIVRDDAGEIVAVHSAGWQHF